MEDILDTGRFAKKFSDVRQIGEGGFGKVYKAVYNIDRKAYAIKVVRLHFASSANPMDAIYNNKVYREIATASQLSSENIVRYYNSWFEELTEEEFEQEASYRNRYQKIIKNLKDERRHFLPIAAASKSINSGSRQTNQTSDELRKPKVIGSSKRSKSSGPGKSNRSSKRFLN